MSSDLRPQTRPPAKVLVEAGKADRIDLGKHVRSFLGRHLRSPVAMVWLVAVLLIAVRWYSCVVENQLDRIDAEQHVSRESANLVQALESHARQLLRDADHDIHMVASERGEVCGPAQLRALAASRLTRYPLGLYDAAGTRCAGTTSINTLSPDATRLRFSTITGKGRKHIQITHGLLSTDGTPAGYAVIEINSDDLVRPAGSLDLGPDGVAMVSLLNGDILARQDGLAITHGRRTAETLRSQSARAGTHHGTDGIDDRRRYFRYSRVVNYPLVVAVGLSEEEALGGSDARARNRHTQSITATAVVLLLATGFTALLRALQRARRRGDEAERLKKQFLNVMSHELRTPLNGILGFSELLQKQVTAEPAAQYLQVVRESALQLNGQIEDMLTFVNVSSGSATVRCREEPIGPLIERVVAMHAGKARAKGLGFETSIEPGTPETAYFDASRTLKMLDHLLHNAIKFTSTGSISLAISGAADEIIISVIDTGSGISEAAQHHLTQSFRQADGSDTREHGGMGLGLALCAGLARQMGMQFEFSSIPGEGTTFSIRIPRQASVTA